jgi:hypothetical protein
MSTAPRGQRASRRVGGVGVLLAAAVLVIGGAVAFGIVKSTNASESSPLGPSSDFGPDVDSPLFYQSISLPFGDSKTNYVLRFKPHSQFRFLFDVYNRGTSPLRIEGVVPPPAGSVRMMRIERVLFFQHKPNTFTMAGATTEPLTIEPGRRGLLIPIVETRGPCRANYEANSSEEFDTIRLRYRYRGKERTERFSLPVVIGMFCGNPEPWLDRVGSP